MDKKELEKLKWLWNKTSDPDRLNQITDAICRIGDIEGLKWLWNKTSNPDRLNQITDAITRIKERRNDTLLRAKTARRTIKKYANDCFICHASEDKEACVRELAEKLSKKGYKVWYDEFTLTLGDSLRRKIDHGLANSRYGVVILSKSFFEKDWPQKELDGLMAKERDGKKVILPIWHAVTREDVEKFSPILAGRVAVSTHKGLDYVVREIIRTIKYS